LSLESYRQSVSAAKHASILKVALTRFLEDGYSKAAMADIAREADVSTATLYKHFASKENLFTAVVSEAAAAIDDDFGALPENTMAVEFFHKILRDAHAAQSDGRVNDLLRISIAEATSSPKLARRVYDLVVGGRLRRLQAVLDEMVARGLLKPHDTAVGAKLALGMIKELFVWPALFSIPALPCPPMPSIRRRRRSTPISPVTAPEHLAPFKADVRA